MGQKTFLVQEIKEGDPIVLIDFIAKYLPLSKAKIKDVMKDGGVWVKKQSFKKVQRVRRAKTELRVGDRVELYHDPRIEFPSDEDCYCVHSNKYWSVWYKAPGVLSQGTKYGDAGSLLRKIEKENKNTFLVHRLDKETGGLILFAHTQKAAKYYSKIWSKEVEKSYQAICLGELKEKTGSLTYDLDDKKCRTDYELIAQEDKTFKVIATLRSGRLHQIRRHFEKAGHPVIGDPKYGRGNKNKDGLKLLAYKLSFQDPFVKKEKVSFELTSNLLF